MWGGVGAEERKNGGGGGDEKEKEGESVDSKKTDNRLWCESIF